MSRTRARAAACAVWLAAGACGVSGTQDVPPGAAPAPAVAPAEVPGEGQPTAPSASSANQGSKTTGSEIMTQGQLDLRGDDFWDSPLRTAPDLHARLMGANQEATLVDAPPQVLVDLRQNAPFVVVRTTTIANAASAPFAANAVLTAVELGSNVTYAALAVRPSGRPGARNEPPSTEPPQKGMSGEAFVLDLRDALEVPWEPGRFVVTLLMRDAVSRRLRVNLEESPQKYVDPAVEAQRRADTLRPDLPPVTPAPGKPLPRYEADADSLEVPAKPGIVLAAPRVFVSTDKAPCVLRGAFRLPVLRRHVMPATAHPGASAVLEQFEDAARKPTGVVRITLVATGSEVAVPFTWPIVVPTYDKIDASADAPVVTGHFALDLQQLGNVKEIRQTLFVYAFSSEAMAGPVPIAFADRAASTR